MSPTRVVIVGGGPGGYEAALVGSRLGANVTLIERQAPGGDAVLVDCVPSKTLIATSDLLTEVESASMLGVDIPADVHADMTAVNDRVMALAKAQSADITERLEANGVRIISGTGELGAGGGVVAVTEDGRTDLPADAILLAVGTHPRVLDTAKPDGERIMTWEQVYRMRELPEHLIVVGSGVTGAEFASAYNGLGCRVTLVSSRDRVLPGEDEDAATLIEEVFRRRGMTVLGKSRMASVERIGDGVIVTLADGRIVEGSHCLLALGSIPSTTGIGLAELGVRVDEAGFIGVDRVSRTSVPGVYAAGDCTGVHLLASVAAQQGRIAMAHLLGDAVHPLDLAKVSANIFTSPEIATVGLSPAQMAAAGLHVETVKLPLATNPRAKMQGIRDGFVKLYARTSTGTIVGGVIVSPRASELIHVVSLAVSLDLTVDQVAAAFTVYPSLSGSVAEAARRLH
ncbi:MAG TPA: NAD(P)H-quinone dehydrogenase [Aeromicrobium sp.]|nr:NAD(P)H-quinone dehydrogenase [Aeromicrobium sp.]